MLRRRVRNQDIFDLIAWPEAVPVVGLRSAAAGGAIPEAGFRVSAEKPGNNRAATQSLQAPQNVTIALLPLLLP
jgi:hypothetical protein